MFNKDQKQVVIQKFAVHSSDTGSPEVQIALLTNRLTSLSEHFQAHKKDHHSRQGFLKMINRRRKLLDYLKCTDSARYKAVVTSLGLKKQAGTVAETPS